MARRSAVGTFRAQQRRQTEWIGSADFTGFTTLGVGSVVLDQNLTGAQVSAISPFTIVRTVGLFAIKSDQVVAAEEGMAATGAMVVQEAARVAGVASIPTPIAEIGDDAWFSFQLGAWSGGPIEGGPVRTYHFDSRAQRKVEDGDAVVWTVENSDGAFALQYSLWFRMLIKVH